MRILITIFIISLLCISLVWAEKDRDDIRGTTGDVKVQLDPNFKAGNPNIEMLLYDNGSLVNSPGTGAGGADESVLQSVSLGMNTLGFGNQFPSGNLMADDFTVTGAGGWSIDSIIVYSYQTNGGIPSTITGVYYEIWDGHPNDPGSAVVFGDLTTNRMIFTEWPNIYRVSETTTGTGTTRAVMKNTASGGAMLPPGTYWLVYTQEGSASSGPWAPPICINGTDSTGNAWQYSSGNWHEARDSGSNGWQGMPFIIHGSVQPAPKLLITELVVTPTAGEFVEIYNPNPNAVDLSDYYLTDATDAGGNNYYYQVVEGGIAGSGFSSDFHVRFPDMASIQPGEYQTVAMSGSAFLGEYGIMPTYEVLGTDPTVPDMREIAPGSIGTSSGLTNSGEVAILYHWDGMSDLVGDVDYVVWGDKVEAVDKTGVEIDGPDPGTDSSMYLPDTPIANQIATSAGQPHAFGNSVHRIDFAEGTQLTTGGNGVTGADETSENLDVTFTDNSEPSPNASYKVIGSDVVVAARIGGESQYRSFWVNGSWDANGFYDPTWSAPMLELNDMGLGADLVAGDNIFTGAVRLAIDSTNTYNWWCGSENDDNSFLDDGNGFNVLDIGFVYSDTLTVDGDAGINSWVIALPGDFNGFNNAADMTRNGTEWSLTVTLTAGVNEYKFAVMHQWRAAYGNGGIGGGFGNYSYNAPTAGDYLFTFDDADNSHTIVPVIQALNPPENVMATVAGVSAVDLTWEAPLPAGGTEIGYDDGSAEGSITIGSTAAGDLAVRFTPNVYPSTILAIKVQFGATTDPLQMYHGNYTIWDGTGTGPGTSLATGTHPINRGRFDQIDVSAAGVQIAVNDFFISYNEPADSVMILSWDTNQPSADRSWVNAPSLGLPWQTSGTIGPTFDNNYIIRAIVREGSGDNARIVELEPSGKSTIAELKKRLQKAGLRGIQTRTGDVRLDGSTAPEAENLEATINPEKLLATVPAFHIEGLTGFNIYRSEDGTTFSTLTSVDSTMFAYTDNTVTAGNTFWYYLTAVYTEGESDPSDTVQVTLPSISDEIAEHNTPRFRTAVTNEGTIGMLNAFGGIPGFEWPLGTNQLFEAGIMVGIAPDQVSDAARVISGGQQQALDEDFQFTTPIDTLFSDADSTAYRSSFDDSRVTQAPLADDGPNTPLPIEITQTSYSYTDALNSGYLILELELTNTGAAALTGVMAGIYFDWDINSFTTNTGEVTFESLTIPGINGGNPFPVEFARVFDNANPNPLVGVIPLSQNIFRASRIADNAEEIFPTGAAPLTEAAKFDYMLTRRANQPYGDPFGPADKSLVVGIGGGSDGQPAAAGFDIGPGATVMLALAIVGGNDATEFIQNGAFAMQKWVDMGNDVIVLQAPVGIADAGNLIPTEFALHQNYPNPFNPTTTIKYDLKQTTRVSLSIYNLLGQEVRTLVNASEEAGFKNVVWDGLNNSGQRVASGVYIYRIHAGDFVEARKMILMK